MRIWNVRNILFAQCAFYGLHSYTGSVPDVQVVSEDLVSDGLGSSCGISTLRVDLRDRVCVAAKAPKAYAEPGMIRIVKRKWYETGEIQRKDSTAKLEKTQVLCYYANDCDFLSYKMLEMRALVL